jgi:phosphonate transport system permease protein
MSGDVAIRALRRARPRSRFLRAALVAALSLAAWSLIRVAAGSEEFLSARQRANLGRFVADARPAPLAGRDFDAGVAARWVEEVLSSRGLPAAAATLGIAAAAAVLAAHLGLLFALPAARTLWTPSPWLAPAGPPGRAVRFAFGATGSLARALLALLRGLPDYAVAFLLVAAVGPVPWAAVLALALPNAGVLGRLFAETAENLPPAAPAALRAGGAGRMAIAVAVLLPAALPRLLLYFFYRFDTCVRGATVLGMLGIFSLGYCFEEARARHRTDELLLLVAVAAVLTLLLDAFSAAARSAVRRS